MCMGVHMAYMYVPAPCVQYLQRPEESILLELELTDSCESPYGCWKQNLGPQEEQSKCYAFFQKL